MASGTHRKKRYRCDHCGGHFLRILSQLYRGKTRRKFCSHACFGADKHERMFKPRAQKKAEKAKYDREYRRKNHARIKQNKRDYFARTYDPAAAAIARKPHAKRHAEYCRRYYTDPKRKAAKKAYDLDRRATVFGPYAGAYKVLLLLRQRVLEQLPDKYERLKAMGYYDNKERNAHA